jgi:hypothetical protein
LIALLRLFAVSRQLILQQRDIQGNLDLAADLSARVDWDSFIDGAVVSPRGVLTAAPRSDEVPRP